MAILTGEDKIIMNRERKKGFVAVIAIMIVLLVCIIVMISNISRKVQLNELPISGNTTGNLNNSGLFCESNGILYFSNAYDNHALYSYNPDNGKCRKLCDGPVKSINVDSHYIYYVREASKTEGTFGFSSAAFKGLYRMNLNGKHKTCLSNGNVGNVQLINNQIFFQNYSNDYGFHLFSIGIDGKGEKEVLAEAVNPTGYFGNALYFCNTQENHNVMKMNPDTYEKELLYEGNCYFPTIQDNYLYFMDVEDNYSLAKVDLTTNEKITLTTERLDTYNLYGDTIFYQVSDTNNPCLKRMKTDGSGMEIIQTGVFHDINITNNYTYFTAYNSTTPIYRTPTTGVVDVTSFTEAFNAVK